MPKLKNKHGRSGAKKGPKQTSKKDKTLTVVPGGPDVFEELRAGIADLQTENTRVTMERENALAGLREIALVTDKSRAKDAKRAHELATLVLSGQSTGANAEVLVQF
jgi:hypothetical protein